MGKVDILKREMTTMGKNCTFPISYIEVDFGLIYALASSTLSEKNKIHAL